VLAQIAGVLESVVRRTARGDEDSVAGAAAAEANRGSCCR